MMHMGREVDRKTIELAKEREVRLRSGSGKPLSERQPGELGDPKTFALAGNATFTVTNPVTGNRFTYKIRRPEDHEAGGKKDIWFVTVLTGPNNEQDYTYLGVILPPKGAFTRYTYVHGRNSAIGPTAPSGKAFAWLWARVDAGKAIGPAVITHEGRCGRCGRTLTVPESVLSGFGPECASKVELAR